jgi:hypothetical protein
MFEIKVREDKPSRGCMWCDDHWPMAVDSPGEHTIEADGIYAEVPCQLPEQQAKRAKHLEPQILADQCWQESCKQYKAGSAMQGIVYAKLLKEKGLTS